MERALAEINNIMRIGFQDTLTEIRALKSELAEERRRLKEAQKTMNAFFQEGARIFGNNNGGAFHAPASENNNDSSPLCNTGPVRADVRAVHIYKLSRRIKTVRDVWKEYKVGLFGGPAVEDLEKNFGTGWRKDRTESRYFCRRKKIYDEVQKVSREKNIPLAQAVESVEERRLNLKLSLDGLQKIL